MSVLSRRRRVWTTAAVASLENGFGVALDGKPLQTPAQRPFCVPSRAMVEAVAAEWSAQGERIAPGSMPLTRLVSTAIDRVADAMDAVVDEVARYGETDLLCYRAPHPEPLTRMQAAAWDPPLGWARDRHGAALACAVGVMHIEQSPTAVTRLHAAASALADRHGAVGLTALSGLVTLSGSLVLALAVAEAAMTADDAWKASRVDEDFQASQWGVDAEAASQAAERHADFHRAAQVLEWLRDI